MVPVPRRQDAPAQVATEESETAARPLAPPEVASYSSEEESSDVDEQEEAVDSLLREVETLRKASSFPGLEDFEAIDQKRETYLGPTMESNWVLPGRLLVGAYPASMNDSHHAHLLCTILLQGVSTFVCLQQEYRADGVTEEMWRSGEALRPYFQDVLQLLRKLQELKAADPRSVPAISAPQDTDFVHFPIVDCNVADDTKVLQLAGKLAGRVARGEVLYLHCWGGHGRTGTVVSIMLHLMYGLSADEAMARCQHVHDVRRIPISVGSPQTDAQRDQVRRVIWRLGRRSRATAAASAAVPRPCESAGEPANGAVACVSEGKQAIGTGSGSGSGARAAAAVGGRRGWVRGRRQAFAQAPNGVGEHVSGWLPGGDGEEEEQGKQCKGKGAAEQDPTVESASGGEERGSGGNSGGGGSSGRILRSRTCHLRENEAGGSLAAGTCPAGGVAEAGPATSVPRRKSFTEPYSEEDPSRGTRMNRLRRKSAPNKQPADVAAKRGAAACVKEDDSAVPPTNGGAVALSSPLKRGSAVLGDSRTDVDVTSPGSCTGVERCATLSSGAGHAAGCGGSSLRPR